MSTRRIKSRPTLSCTRCRERKVKCDRVKPCQACCIHGEPRECVYEEGGEDRSAIAQAQEIQRLRKEVEDLRRRLDDSETDPESFRENIFSQPGSGNSLDASSSSSEDGTNAPPSEFAESVEEKSLVAFNHPTNVDINTRLRNSQPSFSLNLFFANFMDQFLDRTSPTTVTGESNWLRSVAQATPHSRLLSNAFHVVSFFQCGIMSCDRAWEIEGRRIYGKVLGDLQRELNNAERSMQPDVLYTLMVLTIHEILYFEHPTAWLSHISGAAKLFQLRGPKTFMQGLDRSTLLHFRVFDLSLNIFRRKPTFLSFASWKTQLWSTDRQSQDLMEDLFDHMVDLPGYLADADTLAANAASDSFPTEKIDRQRRRLWDSLSNFDLRMQKWREKWIGPWPGNHCRPVQEYDPRCVGNQELFERSLWYADDRIARAMCFYASGRLLLSRVDSRPDRPSQDVLDELSYLICDTSNFLLAVTYDYINVINMLFPLRVAYFTLLPTNPRRLWVEDILWRISNRFNMSFPLQYVTPMLPGKNEKMELA